VVETMDELPVPDEEYRQLLVAAEERYRKSWMTKMARMGARIYRILCVTFVKMIFLVRDSVMLLFDFFFMLTLLPLDALLVVTYFSAVYIEPAAFNSSTPAQDSVMMDLNIIRRLFWGNHGIGVGNNFATLYVPKNIIIKDASAPQDATTVKGWRRNEKPRSQITFIPPYQDIKAAQPLTRPGSFANGSQKNNGSPPSRKLADTASFVPNIRRHIWGKSDSELMEPNDKDDLLPDDVRQDLKVDDRQTIDTDYPRKSHIHYGRRLYRRAARVYSSPSTFEKDGAASKGPLSFLLHANDTEALEQYTRNIASK
jgi:hypothetical protein